MTYSRLSTHDAIGDLDDPEGNEHDSRTPLDRTIDQIGMGKPISPLFPCLCAIDVAATLPLRLLSMGPPIPLWFRCVNRSSPFIRVITEL